MSVFHFHIIGCCHLFHLTTCPVVRWSCKSIDFLSSDFVLSQDYNWFNMVANPLRQHASTALRILYYLRPCRGHQPVMITCDVMTQVWCAHMHIRCRPSSDAAKMLRFAMLLLIGYGGFRCMCSPFRAYVSHAHPCHNMYWKANLHTPDHIRLIVVRLHQHFTPTMVLVCTSLLFHK